MKNNFCGRDEKYLNYSFPQKNPWSFLNHMKFQLKISFSFEADKSYHMQHFFICCSKQPC